MIAILCLFYLLYNGYKAFKKVQRSGCCRDNLLLHDVYCMGDGYLQF